MFTIIAAYALLGLFFVMESRLRKGETAKSLDKAETDRGSTNFIGVGYGISILTMLAAPVLNTWQIGALGSGSAIGWIGILIMLLGVYVRVSAMRSLGQFYTRTLRTT